MGPEFSNETSVSAGSPPRKTFLEQYGISPVLFAFLSLLLLFVLYQGLGGLVTVLLFGLKPSVETAAGFRIATLMGQVLLLLLPALFLTRLATLTPASFLRLRAPRVREVILPLFGIFSLQQILQVYMAVQEKISLPQSVQPIVEDLKRIIEESYKLLVGSSSVPELLFVVLVVAAVPAAAEEFLFRGLVQRSFEQKLGSSKSLVLTSIVFGIYHLNPFSIIPLICLGMYLGFLVNRSGSIWVSVAAHFYNNLFACIALYFGMNDNFVVTGNPENLSGGMLAFTFLSFSAVFLISTYYFMFVTKPVIPSTET